MTLLIAAFTLIAAPPILNADSSPSATHDLIAVIKAIGPKGDGNLQARRAINGLSHAGPEALLPILRAFDDASPIAANWLRGAFEANADRTLKSGRELPEDALEQFILDREHDPRARRLAYEWLAKADPTAPERIIRGMLRDPSPEMRRDAVQRLIEEAEQFTAAGNTDNAKAVYQKALSGAVHDDQIKAISGPLKKLGIEVDLQKHFGFLTEWHVIGPFNHRGGKGFSAAYSPEERIDLESAHQTTYEQAGVPSQLRWRPLSTDRDDGIIDLAKQIENYKGSCFYLTTEFRSPTRRPIELRLGTPNAWKLWLNGKLLFAREEYHRNDALDQYRVPARLEPGPNRILIKICQNEQDEDWAQRYQFRLRIVDPSGSAVLSKPLD